MCQPRSGAAKASCKKLDRDKRWRGETAPARAEQGRRVIVLTTMRVPPRKRVLDSLWRVSPALHGSTFLPSLIHPWRKPSLKRGALETARLEACSVARSCPSCTALAGEKAYRNPGPKPARAKRDNNDSLRTWHVLPSGGQQGTEIGRSLGDSYRRCNDARPLPLLSHRPAGFS